MTGCTGDKIIIGKCGLCGGPVSTPKIWSGVQRAPEQCEKCGAYADPTRGKPVLPMLDKGVDKW